jgi:hypothetical protein
VPATDGTINPQETAFPAAMMFLVIPRRVWGKPVIIRMLNNRTKDGGHHQGITKVVRTDGYDAPTKEVLADFTARRISGTAPATGGTTNPQGTAFPAAMMFLVIPRRVSGKPVIIKNKL